MSARRPTWILRDAREHYQLPGYPYVGACVTLGTTYCAFQSGARRFDCLRCARRVAKRIGAKVVRLRPKGDAR